MPATEIAAEDVELRDEVERIGLQDLTAPAFQKNFEVDEPLGILRKASNS